MDEFKTNKDKIIEIVCKIYNVSFDTVNTKRRYNEYVEVRQAICYFVKKENPNMPLSVIGKLFTPPKHHATVIYSIREYKNLISYSYRVRKISGKIDAELFHNYNMDYNEIIDEYEKF
ncbi:MAG: hypothetical protein LBP85_08460 [Prevotellaceae bacterium]|jgi:chromosomal replication initiation ATPase DnaA|nr:hypothetical protein [Prevotellaceae bacterium]